MKYFEDIINYIEENIDKDIDVKSLSEMANLSIYEFRRIFSFVTKIPFSEYIRKRRLSLAAVELYETKCTVGDIAGKFGYDSPSSFSRAFREFHGISPVEVVAGNGSFRVMTKISTEIITTGGKDVSCKIVEKPSFTVSGFCGRSEITDTECCEDVWNAFYESTISEKICAENEKISAVYRSGTDFVDCFIGTEKAFEGDSITIPASRWACFEMSTTEDSKVNAFYKDILNQWLNSTGYKRNKSIPNVEIFPSDMDEEGFLWEIWMPICK